jgi:rhodanese-related sulfurtransferase
VRRVLAAAAAILGILALFAGPPASRWRSSRRAAGATFIAPVELAEWIRDRKPHLRIVDVRSEGEFEEYHLPRAERFTPATTFAPDDTIVLVAGGSVRARDVYVLRGGVQAWIDEVMNPTIAVNAPPPARAAYERASIVSRYFGGVPHVVDKPSAVRTNAGAVRRRGC